MDGEANWIMGIVIVTGLVMLGLLIAFSKRAFTRFTTRQVFLACPATGEPTSLIVETDHAEGGARKVVSCSRFEDPSHVECDQRCLRQ